MKLPSIRGAIAEEVRSLFREEGQGVSVYEGEGLFPPGAVIRDVHGDVTTMMIGGIAALFLQMLHPLALAGVWDHSDFRRDMQGRLRRTARFIATTTYGNHAQAGAAIDKVRSIHDRVSGALPDGTPYDANDPHLLGWVHITEAVSFLDAYIRYREPMMSRARQDAYFAEIAVINERLGAARLPTDRRAAMEYMNGYRAELVCDERTKAAARALLHYRPERASMAPMQSLSVQAGIDLLPDWARRMHGLSVPSLARPLLRTGALGLTHTLRWALAGP
ncbi:oxygenase MpaB family protein [Novosphingopyxis sp.]|uniref:oxygenase MpaB family protein n=1 Tax=Novosphingopyxis sp. TaxID=2709690 RepID=UPI003B58C3BA